MSIRNNAVFRRNVLPLGLISTTLLAGISMSAACGAPEQDAANGADAINASTEGITGKRQCVPGVGQTVSTGDRPTRVYHWATNAAAREDPKAFIADRVRYSLEQNAKGEYSKYEAGYAFYAGQDPFQARGYGRILVGVDVRPNTTLGFVESASLKEDVYKAQNCPGTVYTFTPTIAGSRAVAFYDLAPLDLESVRVVERPSNPPSIRELPTPNDVGAEPELFAQTYGHLALEGLVHVFHQEVLGSPAEGNEMSDQAKVALFYSIEIPERGEQLEALVREDAALSAIAKSCEGTENPAACLPSTAGKEVYAGLTGGEEAGAKIPHESMVKVLRRLGYLDEAQSPGPQDLWKVVFENAVRDDVLGRVKNIVARYVELREQFLKSSLESWSVSGGNDGTSDGGK